MRYVGCSNFSGWHVMKALEIARRDGRIPFVSQQIHYTLQAREVEYELIPISLDQKLGVLVWSPLAGGLLSGKHRRNKAAPADTRLAAGWKEPPIADENKLWDIVDELVAIADAHKVSPALRSRSPGCSVGQRSRPSSSAAAQKRRSRTTSAPRS